MSNPEWHTSKHDDFAEVLASIAKLDERTRRFREEKAAKSNYVGVEKARRRFECRIIRISSYNSHWGPATVTIMEDADGNVIKNYGRRFVYYVNDEGRQLSDSERKDYLVREIERDFMVGDRISFDATIKRHSEYSGVKETTITRATKIRKIED